jgi:hypothetical protein
MIKGNGKKKEPREGRIALLMAEREGFIKSLSPTNIFGTTKIFLKT